MGKGTTTNLLLKASRYIQIYDKCFPMSDCLTLRVEITICLTYLKNIKNVYFKTYFSFKAQKFLFFSEELTKPLLLKRREMYTYTRNVYIYIYIYIYIYHIYMY